MKRLIPERLGTALRAEAKSRFELSADALHEARDRVRVAAAIGGVAFALFLVFVLSGASGASHDAFRVDLHHDLAGVLICGSLLIATRVRSLSDRVVLRLALVAQVLVCALISFGFTVGALERTQQVHALTWVVPVVILFPLLVPIPPATTLLVSVLCVLTTPLAFAAVASHGEFVIRASEYWNALVTGGIAVGIAIVASHTLYGAARQVEAVRLVGSYELLEPLAKGGMGEVWKAQHLLLARPAAVKLIRSDQLQGPLQARAAVNERFTREARITASLRSPHTVELFDFGESNDGTLYYAMELLDGMNAEHFVYQFGPLEPRRAVFWLRQACHSLGEAHSRGLVHRDIKPANIYLCRYGRDCDFVKILDFGLTRPVVVEQDVSITSPGVRLGTPGYMAPEQILGQPAEPRSDLYALGCVAYFLLAGDRPFEAETAGELMRLHAQAPPPPLSERAKQPVPARLAALIMRCLAKDRKDRHADADELNAALGSSFDGAPWTGSNAREWWDQNIRRS